MTAFSAIIQPDPIILLPDWAESRYRLPAGDPKAGLYRTAYSPYVREILYELSPSVKTKKVVFIKPIQIGGTLLGNIVVLGCAEISPGPCLFVLPTREMAADHVELKFDPAVESMGFDLFPEKKSRQAGNTKRLKRFPGGYIVFAGAEEKSAARSRSVRYLILSDIDGVKGDVGGEGDPVTLFEKRCAAYEGMQKIFIESTPKIKGGSHIEKQYDQSSMGRFHVPCLKCGHMQYLEWGGRDTPYGFKYELWKDGKIKSVWYECAGCRAKDGIEEKKKFIWLNRGEYVHEDPSNPVRGFKIHGLQSPAGMALWKDLALEWVQSQGNFYKLQVFLNTRCSESYEAPGTERLSWEVLRDRAENYRFFDIPKEVFLLSLGVDTHDDRLTLLLVGIGPENETWIIFAGDIIGDPNDNFVWDELDKLLGREFIRKDGSAMRIANCSIDMGGHRGEAVKLYTRARFPQVIAVQGARGNIGPVIAPPVDVDLNFSGRKIKGGAKVWNINTYSLKSTVYGRYRKDRPGPGYIHFPKELPDEVYKQLTAEELVMTTKNGFPIQKWENTRIGQQNHALDCLVYALAGAARIMPTLEIMQPRPIAAQETKQDRTKPIENPVQRQAPRPRKPQRGRVRGW